VARVNVEQKALTDPRFYRLGIELGAVAEHAQAVGLFTMIRIWNECAERERYALEDWIIDSIAGVELGAQKVKSCALISRLRDNLMRVKGTKGRTDYLGQKRRNAKKNGRLGGRPKKTDVGSENNQRRFPQETPPAPAPAPAPALKDKDPPNPPKGGTVSLPSHDEFLQTWNASAESNRWRLCRELTQGRKKALKARLCDLFWRENWESALRRVAPVPGLRGQNEQNWIANVDWFLRPQTVAKIVEGFYDGWKPGKADNGPILPKTSPDERRRMREEANRPIEVVPNLAGALDALVKGIPGVSPVKPVEEA